MRLTTAAVFVGAIALCTGTRAASAEGPVPPVPPPAAEAPVGEPVVDRAPAAEAPPLDPSKDEVPLPARNGWNGTLVYANDVGVWTLASFKAYPEFGCPEIVGLDDKGRLTIAHSYSGKWYRYDAVGDGKWLGGIAFTDLDPRRPGPEIYTGGQGGNLYQVVVHGPGLVSTCLLARMEGREIHTLVAGDLDPAHEGVEMVMFTRPGGVFLVSPRGPGVEFEVRRLQDIPGRIRDAALLPAVPGEMPRIATVSREGAVALLGLEGGEPRWTEIHRQPMGFGRLAIRRGAEPAAPVLYAGRDDGVIVRLERTPTGWREETVYLGPQGVRGLVAGRFDGDPAKETIATFGYGRRVQLLTRERDGWRVETIFEDADKGHWLTTAEVDGRNGTDEIVCSGYSGRVVLLSRPPGFGRPGIATDPDAASPR